MARFILSLCCVLVVPVVLLAQQPSPVDGLRDQLRLRYEPLRDEQTLKDYEAVLKAAAKKVNTSADLCRALCLDDWPTPVRFNSRPEEPGNQAARAVLRDVCDRAVAACAESLKSDQKSQRLALLVLISRASRLDGVRDWGDNGSPFSDLAPIIVGLHAKEKDLAIRCALLTSLGDFSISPGKLVGAIQRGLASKDLPERQAAAQVVAARFRPTEDRSQRFQHLPDSEHADWLVQFAPIVGAAAADEDVTTRLRSLHALAGLVEQMQTRFHQLSPLSIAPAAENAKEVNQWFAEYKQAIPAVDLALAAAVRGLNDKDLTCRLAAQTVLAEAAVARLSLLWNAKTRAENRKLLKAPANAVPIIAESLVHADVRVRLHGLYILEALPYDASPAVPNLVKTLSDDNRFVRWGAARTLRNMAPAGAGGAAVALGKALSDASPDVRNTAAAALVRCGKEGKAALPAVMLALEKGDVRMRRLAATALGAMGAEAKEARPRLVAALADAETAVRAAAATALGKQGKLDQKSREALQTALEDAEEDVRVAAADALLPDERDPVGPKRDK